MEHYAGVMEVGVQVQKHPLSTARVHWHSRSSGQQPVRWLVLQQEDHIAPTTVCSGTTGLVLDLSKSLRLPCSLEAEDPLLCRGLQRFFTVGRQEGLAREPAPSLPAGENQDKCSPGCLLGQYRGRTPPPRHSWAQVVTASS